MNTVIEYYYRDAANYKVWNEAVITGVLTQEQVERILSCLDDGVYFIPSLVGLPEEQYDGWEMDAYRPFFELEREWIHNEEQDATVDITPDHLVSDFERYSGRWRQALYS